MHLKSIILIHCHKQDAKMHALPKKLITPKICQSIICWIYVRNYLCFHQCSIFFNFPKTIIIRLNCIYSEFGWKIMRKFHWCIGIPTMCQHRLPWSSPIHPQLQSTMYFLHHQRDWRRIDWTKTQKMCIFFFSFFQHKT